MDEFPMIGPGPDGDYGEARAKRERERHVKFGLCENCHRELRDHLAVDSIGGEIYRLCPGHVYKAPTP